MVNPAAIRDQLEKILAAEGFSRSERLSAFLRFVVEETIAGRGDTLKEQAIALALYEKRRGSNGHDDSVVRADARRVRDKLREYYAEEPSERIIIALPKGTYTPVFADSAAATGRTPTFGRRPTFGKWLWAALGLIVLSAGVAVLRTRRTPSPPPRIVSLTQYPGGETDPSFSPDGNFIAFAAWSPPGPAPQDIWIKAINSEAARRLTDTPPPVAEHSPAWSPDGKEIAFERVGWAGQAIPNPGVYVVSILGGPERKISDGGRNPKWMPDGRSLLVVDEGSHAIVQIDAATLSSRRIAQSPANEAIGKFDISPDGTTLALIRSKRSGIDDIYLMPIGGGEQRRLTDWSTLIAGLTWTPDGRDIVYDAAGESLWRIPARTSPPGKGKPVAGLESLVTSAARALKPSISPPAPGRPARLAFQVQKAIVNLRMIDLNAASKENVLSARRLLESSRIDLPGPFSRDGERIVFSSYLSGAAMQFWVARRDGAGLRQLASLQAPVLKAGSWSTDGRRIVVDAAIDGNSEIYVVDENDSEPRRLTNDAATDLSPTWSQDGRWIYFSSDRSGRPEIWRTSAAGGAPQQISRGGGIEPAESLDGKYVFFLDPQGENRALLTKKLKVLSVDGGEEKVILEAVRRGLWGVTSRGILFLTAEKDFEAIDLYRIEDAKVTRLGRLPFLTPREFPRITFSLDGRWALANQVERRESDLMMLEGFR